MIQIDNLSISLGQFALHDICLTVEDGEYLVLLGPTGSGKTVLIECIAGMHRRHAGRILIDGQEVTGLYPEERNIGYVPQDYALFPNMTVWENLAYGLRARRLPAEVIQKRVEAMLRLLGLSPLAERYPYTLSGGEKQRTALGRALVTRPRVLLLDEPLSAIDEVMRAELAAELGRIHDAVRGTFLHVCHSFDEAAEVADRIAILHEGRIAQVGTLAELLANPISVFVAWFTGTRNLLPGVAQRAGAGSMVTFGAGLRLLADTAMEGEVVAAIRPESVRLLPEGHVPAGNNVLSGRVLSARTKMARVEVTLDVGVPLICHRAPGSAGKVPPAGTLVMAQVPPETVRLLPADGALPAGVWARAPR
ncbi:MAG: ABC transporter ATP-binding protein [Armatimonadetes bacterium]|nr:ABC transporter ATP-binding protein [Armatimonadota bacterium]